MKFLSFVLFSFVLIGCSTTPPTPEVKEIKVVPKVEKYSLEKREFHLRVTATAYTSHHSQTDKTPYLAAWNNRLDPNVKSIAVSRDLLDRGLINGTKVRIAGLGGTYTVRDKMNKRWRRKIDIYMGRNLRKAKRWGKRSVTIYWDKQCIVPLKKGKTQSPYTYTNK